MYKSSVRRNKAMPVLNSITEARQKSKHCEVKRGRKE
jgi:hypothetical protein